MTVVVDRRADFTLENFRRVTVGREGVAIGDVARRTMDEARMPSWICSSRTGRPSCTG